MRTFAESRGKVLVRLAAAFAVCIGLAIGGIAVHGLLAREAAQAHAFVTEGQRALARGDHGAGVLALERARWLAPREEVVRSALHAAGVKDAESLLPRTLRLVTAPEWSAIAIGAAWLSGLGIALLVTRWRRRGAGWVAVLGGAAFAAAMTANLTTGTAPLAVVTRTDAHLLVAPYPTAAVAAPLANGTMVIVGSPYDDFVHLDDGRGTMGWARRGDVELIARPGS